MFLIVGLGNPENEYSNTRHNVGFDTINEISKMKNIEMTRKKFDRNLWSRNNKPEKRLFF